MYDVKDYRVIFYYSFDDNCFIAAIPELPGCVADGETISEAIENVRLLAKEWIDITLKYNEEVPAPSFSAFPEGEVLNIYDVAEASLSCPRLP